MRTGLISMRGLKVVPELSEAIRQLEKALAKVGDVRLKVCAPTITSEMSVAGRELELSLVSEKYEKKECVFILWGCAIPLGFTPMDRYPNLNTETKNIFHFLGEWNVYLSNLMSMGMGEYAWQSVCLAAQFDVGVASTTYNNQKVRYIQSQLGRWGLYKGLVNGIMSPDLQTSLATLGIQSLSDEEIIDFLNKGVVSEKTLSKTRTGFLSLPQVPFRVSSYGRVHTNQTKEGVEVVVEGSGRVVLDISLGNTIKVE